MWICMCLLRCYKWPRDICSFYPLGICCAQHHLTFVSRLLITMYTLKWFLSWIILLAKWLTTLKTSAISSALVFISMGSEGKCFSHSFSFLRWHQIPRVCQLKLLCLKSILKQQWLTGWSFFWQAPWIPFLFRNSLHFVVTHVVMQMPLSGESNSTSCRPTVVWAVST